MKKLFVNAALLISSLVFSQTMVGIGTDQSLATLQVVGTEARIGGPASQTGTVSNPVLRLHSNSNEDGKGGVLYFNENNTSFGYYLQHNSAQGGIWGEDALTIGAYGGGSHPLTPHHPGLSINRWQRVGLGTNYAMTKFHIDSAEDNAINGTPTATQAENDVVVTDDGKMGVGTISPVSKLEVNGASTNTTAYNAGSGNIIDFSRSNLAYTTANAGAFTLQNMKNGGTYTFSVRGTTSGTSTFTAAGFTVKYVNNGATTAGKETLYTFIVMGSTIYVNMTSGF